jgi:Uma2 family endonuclease
MNATSFAKVDPAAFYRTIEGRRDGRYELERGYIVQQMTGGTLQHSLIAARIRELLRLQIDAAHWLVLQDRGVDVSPSIRYPDVVIEPVGGPRQSLSTRVPALVFEVLSPSTTSIDLDVKPAEYLALASLQAYVVASQNEAACLMWLRAADGRFPAEPVELGASGVIALPQLNVAIPVADIYRDILPATSGDAPPGT